ncbi:MAG: hypothetical protein GY724_25770, partial [Actinomycetia bacterium]|nr:hypothetical protein [Actinomycetes bacterium]
MGRLEFGPDLSGVMRITTASSHVVGTMVWCEDNSLPGYSSYTEGFVYWNWSSGSPFPAQDFFLTQVAGPPP